jgi:hypothetical protein
MSSNGTGSASSSSNLPADAHAPLTRHDRPVSLPAEREEELGGVLPEGHVEELCREQERYASFLAFPQYPAWQLFCEDLAAPPPPPASPLGPDVPGPPVREPFEDGSVCADCWCVTGRPARFRWSDPAGCPDCGQQTASSPGMDDVSLRWMTLLTRLASRREASRQTRLAEQTRLASRR